MRSQCAYLGERYLNTILKQESHSGDVVSKDIHLLKSCTVFKDLCFERFLDGQLFITTLINLGWLLFSLSKLRFESPALAESEYRTDISRGRNETRNGPYNLRVQPFKHRL